MNFLFLIPLLLFQPSLETTQHSVESITVVWENTNIDIPLGKNLYDYAYIPRPTLYINGNIIVDNDSYIEYGVNHTTLNVISTNYVNEYHIYYRYTSLTYDYSSTTLITINIVDITKPTIHRLDSISVPLGTTLSSIKYSEYISYSDNYDNVSSLILSVIGTSNIKNNIVGSYPLVFRVIDKSNNYVEQTTYIHIIDDVSPTIKEKGEFILNIGEELSLSKYFEIKDNYDLVLNIIVEDEPVEYNKIGDYIISLYVSDDYGNEIYETYVLKIRDIESPVVIFTLSLPTIDIYDLGALKTLDRFILSITDNHDFYDDIDIQINHNIDINTLGKYDVSYIVSDSSQNTTTKTITISVSDLRAPEIELMEDLVFEVFSEEPVWFFCFRFQDNYDLSGSLKIEFTEKIDMKKTGRYQLVVDVSDSSKNKTSEIHIVEIVDTTAPEIRQINELVVFDFIKRDFTHYFEFKDNYDGDLLISFDDHLVNYEEIGEYVYNVSAQDKSKNKTTIQCSVFVLDNELPTITLKQDTIYLSVFDDLINLEDNIKSIEDNYDVGSILLEINDNFEKGSIGLYYANYKVIDISGNYTTKRLSIYVVDYTIPIIKTADYVSIKKNESIRLLDDVIAIDDFDGDLTAQIKFFPSSIDTSRLGKHRILYYVCDRFGNYTTFNKTIEILDTFNFTPVSVIPSIVIALITCGIVIFFLKKNKNT